MKSHYELTVGGRLGPGLSDNKEATVLNRVIRWTEQGVEYEADPRQVERLFENIGLDGDGVKGVVMPGQQPQQQLVPDEKELPGEQHTMFQGFAARANFLAADRIDMIYAAKDICRFMAKPTDLVWAALKRVARYPKARPRMVCSMHFQICEAISVYSDRDWAGCLRTHKSTSGGCVMLGSTPT